MTMNCDRCDIGERQHVVLVCGGRGYSDQAKVFKVLGSLNPRPALLVQGGATGADTLAAKWSELTGTDYCTFHALWTARKNAAGPMRNLAMLRFLRVHLVVAFPGGNGTAHMVMQARKAKIPVMEVEE